MHTYIEANRTHTHAIDNASVWNGKPIEPSAHRCSHTHTHETYKYVPLTTTTEIRCDGYVCAMVSHVFQTHRIHTELWHEHVRAFKKNSVRRRGSFLFLFSPLPSQVQKRGKTKCRIVKRKFTKIIHSSIFTKWIFHTHKIVIDREKWYIYKLLYIPTLLVTINTIRVYIYMFEYHTSNHSTNKNVSKYWKKKIKNSKLFSVF